VARCTGRVGSRAREPHAPTPGRCRPCPTTTRWRPLASGRVDRVIPDPLRQVLLDLARSDAEQRRVADVMRASIAVLREGVIDGLTGR
jgi:hypothetical protein